ncbi:S-layer homology domain-containing protein [Pseudoflavonifractor phocaeensis]|uniref:S-layer homology domain-containing protein n=1 Tax=Pseudoflavonifractor phocaeensis TaxID=1870988 RepID=UPI00195E0AA1|nr:S-layer homology domain-containing protein [Pseudoflavonifractor phocaeensis]MBM6937374.1 S-layer homology domain-containing protein [Pseudoflavonifractor phocaeensis]
MKRVLSFLLSLVFMVGISTTAFAAGNTYNDVSTSHWAYQYIESVTEKGLFGGVGGGKFSPETPFTRAQVTQTLYNAYSQTLTGTLDSNTGVSGLTGREWYKTPLRWALSYNLLDGAYNDMGSIYGADPEATCDRKGAALAMYRLAGALGVELPATNAAIDFPDIAALDAEYQTAITALQRAGVLAGLPGGIYGPNEPLNRAQAATILDRFTDIPGLESTVKTTPDQDTANLFANAPTFSGPKVWWNKDVYQEFVDYANTKENLVTHVEIYSDKVVIYLATDWPYTYCNKYTFTNDSCTVTTYHWKPLTDEYYITFEDVKADGYESLMVEVDRSQNFYEYFSVRSPWTEAVPSTARPWD